MSFGASSAVIFLSNVASSALRAFSSSSLPRVRATTSWIHTEFLRFDLITSGIFSGALRKFMQARCSAVSMYSLNSYNRGPVVKYLLNFLVDR